MDVEMSVDIPVCGELENSVVYVKFHVLSVFQ